MDAFKGIKESAKGIFHWKRHLPKEEIENQYFALSKKNIELFFLMSVVLVVFNIIYLIIASVLDSFVFPNIEIGGSLMMIGVFSLFIILRLALWRQIEINPFLARFMSTLFWCLTMIFVSEMTILMIYNDQIDVLLQYIIFLSCFVIFGRVRFVDSILVFLCAIAAQLAVCFYAKIYFNAVISRAIWIQIFLFAAIFFVGQQFVFLNILKLSVSMSMSEKASRIDYLTNLYNRRGYHKLLEAYIAKAESVTMIIIDIDNFKDYNDKYGHREGDQAIVKICTCIKNHFSDCLVCRWGGEEILITAIDSSEEVMCQSLEKLLRKIECLHIPAAKVDMNRPYLTISAGVATSLKATFNDDEMVRQADQSLYFAKKSGRNCVRFNECAKGEVD